MQYFLCDVKSGSVVLGLIIIGCTKKAMTKKNHCRNYWPNKKPKKKAAGKQLSIWNHCKDYEGCWLLWVMLLHKTDFIFMSVTISGKKTKPFCKTSWVVSMFWRI